MEFLTPWVNKNLNKSKNNITQLDLQGKKETFNQLCIIQDSYKI